MSSRNANKALPATMLSFENEPVAIAAAPDEEDEVAVPVLDLEDEPVEVPVVVVFFPVVVVEEDETCEPTDEVLVAEEPEYRYIVSALRVHRSICH